MPYSDNDSEDDDYRSASLIVVQRQHYEAGMEVLKTAALGNEAFAAAEKRRDECRAQGDEAGAAFWNSVWSFLMNKAVVAAGAEAVILEEGEEWDAEKEKVIRPRKRSGRGKLRR